MTDDETIEFRRRFWILAGISLVLILTGLASYWLTRGVGDGSPMDRCALVEESRTAAYLTEQDQVRIANADFTTLVRLIGFVRYKDKADQERLLPLRLHNVTQSRGLNGDTQLVLWTECAKLTMNLASDSKQLIVGSIEVGTVKVGTHRRECQVQSTAIRLPDVGLRYLCDKPASYECKSGFWHGNDTFVMRTVAMLDVQLLEFEIDGKSHIIRTNQFSKEVAPSSSCN